MLGGDLAFYGPGSRKVFSYKYFGKRPLGRAGSLNGDRERGYSQRSGCDLRDRDGWRIFEAQKEIMQQNLILNLSICSII